MQPSFPMEFEEVDVRVGTYFEFVLPKKQTGELNVFLHVTYRDYDDNNFHCLAWALVNANPQMHCVWGGMVKKPMTDDIQAIVNAITWAINSDEQFYDSLEEVIESYE